MYAARQPIVARFVTALVSVLSCSPLAAAHPKLAAAKGEQVEKHITLFPSRASAVEFPCALRANNIPPPALACGFYGPSANAGYAVRRIDGRYAAGLSLPVFRDQHHVTIFWSKNRLFSAFAAHLCGM